MTNIAQIEFAGWQRPGRMPDLPRLRDILILLLIGFLPLALSPKAFIRIGMTQCRLSPLPFSNFSLASPLIVKSGILCPVTLPETPGSAEEFIVAAQPQHGTVWSDGDTQLIYRSDQNFRGEDFFVLERTGRFGPEANRSEISVTVIVK